jgi:uncharacterized protein (TIGR00288 family)
MSRSDTPTMAVFCDFENVALGVRDARLSRFDMQRVLERLLTRGSIIVKKAYCNWSRFAEYRRELHRFNFELIEVPGLSQSGKNSADIRMVVDALDLCYTKEHLSTFVLITGDSDFSPLVSKLRENNKQVIGVGVRNSTSELLVSNCDEFIFYDDIHEPRGRGAERDEAAAGDEEAPRQGNGRGRGRGGSRTSARSEARSAEAKPSETRAEVVETADEPPATKTAGGRRKKPTDAKPADGKPEPRPRGSKAKAVAPAPETVEDHATPEEHARTDENGEPTGVQLASLEQAFEVLLETLEAIFADRDDTDIVWGSMLKQTLRRRRPDFSEKLYGFKTFGGLLEEAEKRGLVVLTKDEKRGDFRLLGFGPNG